MERHHYKKSGTIAELFIQDRKTLHPLPQLPFEVYRLELAKADNYGKVKYDNHVYSSSPDFAGRQIWLKVGAHEVILLNEDYQEIIRHDRLYGDLKESMKWVPYLELMVKRPRSLQYTGFFRELPTPLQEYLETCDKQAKKAALRVLIRMVQSSSLETAATIFTDTLSKGLRDPDSLWANYLRLISPAKDLEMICVPPKVPELSAYPINAAVYDLLLKGGGHEWKQ